MSQQPPQAPWRTSSYSSGANNCVEIAHVPTLFRNSSYSNGQRGECVEVASLPAAAAIRDTKHRHLGALVFPTAEWNAFLAEVKAGRV